MMFFAAEATVFFPEDPRFPEGEFVAEATSRRRSAPWPLPSPEARVQ
jgi:hypothetical protein